MCKFFLTFFAILATCLGFLAASSAYMLHATWAYAEGITLGINPPIFQITATPPSRVEAPFTVVNLGDSSLNLNMELRPFVPSDREDGQIKYISETEANFADPLILQRVKIFDSNGNAVGNFNLLPKQQKKLTLTIDIPKDSPPSDYYFSMIFLTGGETPDSINSSQAKSGIASNILLSVGGNLEPKGTIQEFSGPVFKDAGPVPFTVRVKNTGNHFITPHGDILIKNIFGQTVGRVDLTDANVLSSSIRSIPSKDSPDTLAYWPEKFLLGIYKATLTLAISDQGPIYQRDLYFFALPFTFFGGIVTGIIILLYMLAKVRSKI